MGGLTWIHLSDWHQKGKDFDRQVVRDRLMEDIENRIAISPDLAEIDFIVFSGDVAFSGKAEEYQAAKKEFFEHLSKASDVKPESLFIVPGNHDLNLVEPFDPKGPPPPKEPPADPAKNEPKAVFLSDMPEKDPSVGHGEFGKKGQMRTDTGVTKIVVTRSSSWTSRIVRRSSARILASSAPNGSSSSSTCGSVASALYGEARSTRDIDLVAAVLPHHVEPVLADVPCVPCQPSRYIRRKSPVFVSNLHHLKKP
jgi:hypothetical protein